jgi:RNA polymerase sigma-70 factor (ECF subfamily)
MTPDRRILETELLVTRHQRNDPAAFPALVELWERPLFYYLRRLVDGEQDAWDLVQETWLKTVRALPGLRDPRAFPAFLYTTARRSALTRRRGLDHQANDPPVDDPPAPDTNDPVARFDNVEQVHRALGQLPLPQREALTLFFLQDLSIEEMSQVLGVPEGTVKSRLHYAKQAVRKILTNGDDYDH